MPQSNIPIYVLKQTKGEQCCNCGDTTDLQFHHVIPIALGGQDVITNIVPLCGKCHRLIHGRKTTNLSLSELTKKGLEKARLEGKQIGQKKGTKLVTEKSLFSKKIIVENNIDFQGSLTDKQTIDLLQISRNTFYKYKRELREERANG